MAVILIQSPSLPCNCIRQQRPAIGGVHHNSLVVLDELRADVNVLAGGDLHQGLAVAPGELAVDVAVLGCVAAQLRQPGCVILLHSCTVRASCHAHIPCHASLAALDVQQRDETW